MLPPRVGVVSAGSEPAGSVLQPLDTNVTTLTLIEQLTASLDGRTVTT
jgi:hypothetical protein